MASNMHVYNGVHIALVSVDACYLALFLLTPSQCCAPFVQPMQH